MKLGATHRFGRIPYWKHNGHTATVVGRIEYPDGTADVEMECDCGADTWRVAVGVDHSEEAPVC